MTDTDPTLDMIQSSNWIGSIPVQLTLATTSVSTPTVPTPMYVLVSRHSYLHIALQTAIMRLYQYAPVPISFQTGTIQTEPERVTTAESKQDLQSPSLKFTGTDALSNYNTHNLDRKEEIITTNDEKTFPVCWFEDDETGLPLRWHLFAGVLFDLLFHRGSVKQKNQQQLPWKLRLHFINYPIKELLPFQEGSVLMQIRQHYQHSIKQSLALQYGTGKVALNITKESHGLLWESVIVPTTSAEATAGSNYQHNNNYKLFRQSCKGDVCDFNKKKIDAIIRIPIRLYIDSKPPIQPSLRCVATNTISDDGQQQDHHQLIASTTTLGDVFVRWIPEYFMVVETTTITPKHWKTREEEEYNSENTRITWKIAGIQEIPLNMPIFDLWQQLCHPDQFLYIVVLTHKQ